MLHAQWHLLVDGQRLRAPHRVLDLPPVELGLARQTVQVGVGEGLRGDAVAEGLHARDEEAEDGAAGFEVEFLVLFGCGC